MCMKSVVNKTKIEKEGRQKSTGKMIPFPAKFFHTTIINHSVNSVFTQLAPTDYILMLNTKLYALIVISFQTNTTTFPVLKMFCLVIVN